MTEDDAAAVLQRWHDAVNAGAVDDVLALCSQDVAILGPRGVGYGHDLVRGWLERSGIRLEPLEPLVATDGRFVVRERARWTTATSEPVVTWCVFEVAAGLVTSVARYADEDEIPPV